jgi:AraC-like DNA-binding protein
MRARRVVEVTLTTSGIQYEPGALDMPQSRVFTFADPYAFQAAFRAVDVDLLVTSKGTFRANMVQIDLGRLLMQKSADSLPRIMRATIGPTRAPIMFIGDMSQKPIHLGSRELHRGEIVFWGRNATDHLRTSAASRNASMSLTPEDLATAGHSLTGREITVPSDTVVVRPAPRPMARLMGLHETAAQLAESAPNTLAKPAVAKALEQELVHAMVNCLSGHMAKETERYGRQHAKVIARFEDFLMARRYDPVHLAEMCTAIGVSERTLRSCCHEHFGMGPIHYLWLRRMQLARRALLQADPATTRVTSMATEYGFWELGRFSVEYRALFGESPSASLRRPPDDAFSRRALH